MLSGDLEEAPDEGQTTGSQSIEVSGRSVRLVSAELRARVLDPVGATAELQPGGTDGGERCIPSRRCADRA